MKSTNSDFCKKYYVNRYHTDSIKWDVPRCKWKSDDIISMWVADMDFQTPPEVRNALIQRIEHGVFGYSIPADAYYQSVCKWHEKLGYSPRKEWIRFSPGVVPSLYWAISAFTKPKDSVMILTPVYFPFQDAIKDSERTLVTSGLLHDENGYYQMDLKDIESKIKRHNVKLLIHCSPHNPVGRVWTGKELEELFQLCEQYDVKIVSDEIHQDIVIGGSRFVPAASVAEGKYHPRLIVLNSASKTFNLAGLGLAHVIIPDAALRKQYDSVTKSFAHAAPNILGILATQTAYEQGREWLEQLLCVIEQNYQYFYQTLSSALPKLIISPLQGTYLAWVDMRPYLTPGELKDFFAKKCHLAVHYGELFGKDGAGFVRFNLATHPDLVKEACARIIDNLRRI